MSRSRDVRRLRWQLVVAVIVQAALLSWTGRAEAYSWMIRHEYSGCAQCHADPSGGGLLTEYGRAQGEVLLRMRYGAAVHEPGKVAEFLLGLFPLPAPLLLGGDVREAVLFVQPAGQPSTTDVFLMQGDVEGQVAIDRFRANASLGFAQQGAFGAAITREPDNNLVSRVHWLGVDLGDDDAFVLRAGRMNLPFGLRSVEHVAWTRMYTRTDSNDAQQDGLAFAWNLRGWRGEVMGIAGNFQESPDAFRERGYSGYVEWDPASKVAIGVSSLVARADQGIDPNGDVLPGPLLRQAHGLFARYSPIVPIVLSTEADFLLDSQPSTAMSSALTSPGFVGQLEADVEPIQGLHFAAIGELLDKVSDLAPEPGVKTVPWLRGWGFINWFFAPHADVRLDAIYELDAEGPQRLGITTLLAQLHVFL